MTKASISCGVCGGTAKLSLTTYYTHFDGHLITVQNVPCYKCAQCGEEFFRMDTLRKVDEIVSKLKTKLSQNEVVRFAA